MKKRFLALFLAGVLSLSVTACGGTDSGAAAADAQTAEPAAVTQEAPAAESEEETESTET